MDFLTQSPMVRRGLLSWTAVLLLIISLSVITTRPVRADSYQVNTTDDADDSTCDTTHCSLSEAINAANGNPGADTITFAIGTGAATINLTSAFSNIITDPVTIDGTTQPGYSGTPLIELNGTNAPVTGDVLNFNSGSDGSVVRGLIINNHSFGGGIFISEADGITIAGNYIGTNAAGTLAAPNTTGISMTTTSINNIIGGTTASDRNIISGNQASGISITFGSSATIQGNYIGTNAAGTGALPNARGIFIRLSSSSTIGGTTAGAGNVIRYNTEDGVYIADTPGTLSNQIRANTISDNGQLGIDLGTNGVTANDTGDADTGPNSYQNFPVITSAVNTAGTTTVYGTVNSTAFDAIRLDFYSQAACDSSGYGEGETYLGTTSVTTNAIGNRTFSFDAGSVAVGQVVSATATNPENETSEFSACATVTLRVPFVVNTTDDVINGLCDGTHCSLREAITESNAQGGMDTINFAIGTGAATIAPTSALPNIVSPLTIDGNTQPGFVSTPLIELNGASLATGNGLTFASLSTSSVVRGLVINRFPGHGISVQDQLLIITGNYIGTNAAGTGDAGNGMAGIHITSVRTMVGGTTASDRNIISGNTTYGVQLNNSDNTIQGNYIGTDITGTAAIPNNVGVGIVSTTGTIIGGADAGEGNLISGNLAEGIRISAPGSNYNFIEGNLIGISAGGGPLGNNLGISVAGDFDTRIGSTVSGAGNVIRYNTTDGIVLTSGITLIRGNSISDNGELGIDINNDGVNANDPGDGDGGANFLQNFPVITSAVNNGGTTTITGTLNSGSLVTYTLDFYTQATCDASGYGEGGTVLGSTTATTDGSGNATFTFVTGNLAPGEIITSTANYPASFLTSEFSACATVTATTYVVNTAADTDDGACTVANCSLREAINASNSAAGADTINFAIGSGAATITPTSALPGITDTVMIDGTTQPGFTTAPLIELDGSSAGSGVSGLYFDSGPGGSTVRGLVINRFAWNGIRVEGANDLTITGNYIGTNAAGTADAGNGSIGLSITFTTNTVIGGTTTADRNIISGNTTVGVLLNVTTDSVVLGNYIGTDVTGTVELGNGSTGIEVYFASATIIGGTGAGEGNLISGNDGDAIDSIISTNTVVEGNIIRNNDGAGVSINDASTSGNRVRGNEMSGNTGLGIDLNSDGVTTNDVGDGDSGPNGLQNFPIITSALQNAGTTTIEGTLNTSPNVTFAVDLYAQATCDPSGYGEGEISLGTRTIMTDSSGDATFSFSGSGLPAGTVITATAFNTPGSTSEFSACFTVTNSPLVVNKTADTNDGVCDADCSLREAITAANTQVGADTIAFAIGTGTQTISPTSLLPQITDTVTIDGTTQPGYTNAPLIVLDGTGIGPGTTHVGLSFRAGADNSAVRALVVNNVGGTGIGVTNVTGLTITGSYIGTDATGTAAAGNVYGISMTNSSSHVIGGTTASARNIISGNTSSGISFANASNITVQGNYIGLNVSGTAAVPNISWGIVTSGGADNTIGGTAAGARNVISGNAFGLRIEQDTLIQGNYIGTNAAGTAAVPNTTIGIFISGSGNTIGGVGAGNLISGNPIGIGNGSTGTANNVIQGNYIGTQAGGTGSIPNTSAGIHLYTSAGATTVGGTAAGEGNIIRNNGQDGIRATDGSSSSIRGNEISNNGGLGIDLNNDGVTANDPGDSDTGTNSLQNFPVITSAVNNAGTTTVIGTLNSAASATFSIDFYSQAACDASGSGEGETYLGSTSVTTNGAGNGSFSFNAGSVAIGQVISATATDSTNNTSEFSACATVTELQTATVEFATTGLGTPDESATSHNIGVVLRTSNGGPLVNAITVDVSDLGTGTATLTSDYTFSTQTLTFPAGTAHLNIQNATMAVVTDTLDEPDESVRFALGNVTGTNASLGSQTTFEVGITDDDLPPQTATVEFSASGLGTADESATGYNIGVVLRTSNGGPLVNAITVDVSDLGTGTATLTSDYTFSTQTLTFPAGTAHLNLQNATMAVVADTLDEPDESVRFALGNVTGTNASFGSQTTFEVGITDDDLPPQTATVEFSASGLVTTDESATSHNIGVFLTTSDGLPLANDITVDVSDLGTGTATLTSDYTFSPQTLTFVASSANGTVQNATMAVVSDILDEPNESVNFGFTNLTGTNVGIGAQATYELTITDDDTQTATVQFSSSGFTTPDEAGTTYNVDVVLTTSDGNPLINAITVDVSNLATGTAGAGDYSFSTTTLTFTAGALNGSLQTAMIAVVSDTLYEPSETVDLGLGNLTGTNASLGAQTTFTLTITDDDTQTVTLEFSSAGVTTPDESGTSYNLDVVLTTSDGQPLIDQVTVDVSNLGTGTAGVGDYSFSTTALTFAVSTASGSTQTATIAVVSDTTDEPNETVELGLTNLSGANASLGAQTTFTLTITDDDAAIIPSVTVSRARLRMHVGATRTYTVVLDAQPTGDVTITVSQPERCVVRPRTLIFTPANWNTPQTVTVRARNFPDTRCRVRHTATGGGYDGVVINPVLVRILSPAWE